MQPIVTPLVVLALGYALGSIPFGLLLTRLTGAGDLRQIGSGNIGATNVLRTGRKGLAAATLLFDSGKGAAAVVLAGLVWPDQPQLPALAGIGAFFGHLYPVWLGFSGGKGVATLAGIVAVLHWPTVAVAGAVWILVVVATRYSSLAGILAALSGPAAAAFFGRFDLALLFLGFALMILWTHRANIGRLVAGTESRVGGGA